MDPIKIILLVFCALTFVALVKGVIGPVGPDRDRPGTGGRHQPHGADLYPGAFTGSVAGGTSHHGHSRHAGGHHGGSHHGGFGGGHGF